MNEKINQYIQQQVEAAKAKRLHQRQEFEENAAREAAEDLAVSTQNTLRVLSLLGIEAGEGDLGVRDDFVSFIIGNIRLSLKSDKVWKNGNYRRYHLLEEEDIHYSGKPVHKIRFEVVLRHLATVDEEHIPPTYWNVHEHGEHGIAPSRLPDRLIAEFFDQVASLEEQYAHLLKVEAPEVPKSVKPEPIAIAAPKFTYSGDSREAILSQLLRDIANPPKLECPECGRKSVDSVDFYCTRCGVDYEV
jgi:hypothetical protein